MQISQRSVGDVTIIDLNGKMTLGEGDELLRDKVNSLVQQGVAVIMVSSEMPELLGMSDRVVVMHEGRLAAEFDRAEATQEKILAAAMGVN